MPTPKGASIQASRQEEKKGQSAAADFHWGCTAMLKSALIIACILSTSQCGAARSPKNISVGENEVVVDETESDSPKDYSATFDEDLKKKADPDDIYDELLPSLPKFQVVKNGIKAGFSRVPIVTRKQSAWSTPLPRTLPSNKFRTWGTYTPMPLRTTERPPAFRTFSSPLPTVETQEDGRITTAVIPAIVVELIPESSGQETTESPSGLISLPDVPYSPAPPPTETRAENDQTTTTTTYTPPVIQPTAPVTEPTPEPALITANPRVDHSQTNAKYWSSAIQNPAGVEMPPLAPIFQESQRMRQPGGWAWSHSWKLFPNGTLMTRRWDSRSGETMEVRQMPQHHTSSMAGSFDRYSSMKMEKIDCPALNVQEHGSPTEGTNNVCRQFIQSGISADQKCKCNYEMVGSDERGCATEIKYKCVLDFSAPL